MEATCGYSIKEKPTNCHEENILISQQFFRVWTRWDMFRHHIEIWREFFSAAHTDTSFLSLVCKGVLIAPQTFQVLQQAFRIVLLGWKSRMMLWYGNYDHNSEDMAVIWLAQSFIPLLCDKILYYGWFLCSIGRMPPTLLTSAHDYKNTWVDAVSQNELSIPLVKSNMILDVSD